MSTGLSETNATVSSLSTTLSSAGQATSSLSSSIINVNNKVDQGGASVAAALGGGATYNAATGDISAPSYTTQAADGSTVSANNVGDALSNLYANGTKYFKTNSVAPDAKASGVDAVAVGPSAVASGASSVAMGSGAQATGTNAIAIGTGALATGSQAIGAGAKAGGGGVALGDGADAGGTPASASSNISRGTAIGFGAVVQQSGGVAIGTGSVASTAAGVAGYVAAGASAQQAAAVTATTSTQAAVSVGDASSGQYRQVTGVAAGTANSDAVNVSQLKAMEGQQAMQMGALQSQIGDVARIAYSGVAMAFAMSGTYMPTLYPGEKALGVGVGGYRGYGAVGVNFKALNKEGNMSWGAGVSTTGREWGINAGIGWKWK